MYQVIIADSEYNLNSKLKYNINWHEEGFNVAYVAKTVSEVMSFASHSKADLVFTDMNFPDASGVELIRFIRTHLPYAKIVVVSENTAFKLVKSAYKMEVFDYITKGRFNAKKLKEILDRFKADESRNNTPLYNEHIVSDEYVSKRKQIINILTQKSTYDTIDNMLIAAVKIFNYQLLEQIHSSEDLSILVHNIMNTILRVIKDPVPVVFQDNTDNIMVCMRFDKDTPETAIMNSINAYVKRINFLVKKFFNLSLSWGISGLSNKKYTLFDCREDALKMLKDMPIAERRARFDVPELSTITLDEEKKVLSAIQTLDYDSIDKCLDSIFAVRIHAGLSVHILTGELIAIANKLCSELNIDLTKADEKLFRANSFSEDDSQTEQGLQWSKNLFHSIIRLHMEQTRPSRHSTYARFVRTFIADNFKEDITLKTIAETMGITEQHLSKIFKEETGEKLSSYLCRYRIDRAKELLESDVNIKYLYSEVGFKNYNYFFVVFKKSVGCTPNEYKKSHLRKSDTASV